jgi:hypothetical protein
MADETHIDDAGRPLTPEERKALRRLIAKEPEIVEAATNFAHLGWFLAALVKTAKWVAAVIGGIVAWQTYQGGQWGPK